MLETVLSNREVDASLWVVGFTDPMLPEEDDRGHPIPPKNRPLIPNLPLPHSAGISIVTLTEDDNEETGGDTRNDSCGGSNDLDGEGSGAGTDYEDEGEDEFQVSSMQPTAQHHIVPTNHQEVAPAFPMSWAPRIQMLRGCLDPL